MINSKVCLCGSRVKSTFQGVALAVELLVKGFEQAGIPTRIVDPTFRDKTDNVGRFSGGRAVETLWVILMVWLRLFSCRIYYATMSTSPLGFIRDFLTVGFASLLRRRVILHLHGGGFDAFYTKQASWLQALIRFHLRRTDKIVVLGELLKEQFYCAGEFIKEKLVVVPNGLTLGAEEPPSLNKVLPHEGRIQLLYLSSLMPSKGYMQVIDAMKQLETEFPGRFHLNLCGHFVHGITEERIAVNDEESLNHYLRKHSLFNVVQYHGQVSGPAKDELLKEAHVFVLPTQYPWEGQPLSIIEALAYSIPVVTCFHKGIPELVENEKTGMFVEPDSAGSIARAVIRMTTNPSFYSSLSRASRAHYQTNFKREIHLKRLIAVIMDCPEDDIPEISAENVVYI